MIDGEVTMAGESGKEPFACWAILELMGHRRLAGYVQAVEIAGKGMLRIDVFSDSTTSQWYNPDALYAITPTTEALARQLAARIADAAPVSRYELPPAPIERPVCVTCGNDIENGKSIIMLGPNRFRHMEC